MLALSLLSEGGAGPDTSLSLLLYIGIAFFFLIITAGWLSSNTKQDQAEVTQESEEISQAGKVDPSPNNHEKNYLLYVILVLSGAILWGCATTSSNANADVIGTLTPVPSDFAGQTNPFGEEAADAGAAVFKNNYGSCHGRQGHGDGPAGTALSLLRKTWLCSRQ
ncbi:hypothetical protein [Candidatus Villigracilis saccharophilus]|uniref:hypothetical protein n=1 Tax=Candidatus Villigracilis saccharophilus TaxID=3140684 RepID=UPI003136DD44|nr:hypothetical protein [Anaerolineales bacterium]